MKFTQWWDEGVGKPVSVGYDCAKAAWDAQEKQKAELLAALQGCITNPGAACYSNGPEDHRAYIRRLAAINVTATAAIFKATGELP